MSKRSPKVRYVKNIVLVHGKSEQIICEYIKSNLRLPIEIFSHNNGKNNIEINSVNLEGTGKVKGKVEPSNCNKITRFDIFPGKIREI